MTPESPIWAMIKGGAIDKIENRRRSGLWGGGRERR